MYPHVCLTLLDDFKENTFLTRLPKDQGVESVHTRRFHPGIKLERILELHTGALNVKFHSVLEGALNSITQGSIIEIINISLNFYVLIIILITFVIHFFTLHNNDVMDCIILHHCLHFLKYDSSATK